MMRTKIHFSILSALLTFTVAITGLSISTNDVQAFSCSKVVGGQTVEMCCNQTGASCSAVFGAGWTGTCSDISVSGICSSTDYQTMCGPQANQQCVMPTGIADDPFCKAQRSHVTEDLVKILRVHGLNAPSSQPLESVSVTVWFNKAQMAQLNRYGDKLGDPAWGSRSGDPLAGYVVYWTGKDDLQNMGDGLGREFELGYTTNALISGKNQRGYNFGNVLQFLQISDNDALMKLRIRVQARSFRATAGYYCADPDTGRCEYKEDADGSLGFLAESSCQAECRRWCPEGDGYDCAPRPGVNDAYYYVLACSKSDQACIDSRPDDWRKGSRSTWRNMTTIFDKIVEFDRYECLPDGYPNQGNSNFTMRCMANQCNVDEIAGSKFRFRLDNIVQPLAMYPGAVTSFNLGFGFESQAGGNDVYGNPGYYWSQEDKFALRQFLGTPAYEGWYELRNQDSVPIDEVKCQRWNDLSTSAPILDCPNKENLHYRLVYLITQVGQQDRLSRFVDLWGYTPLAVPENNGKNDCTTSAAVAAGNCKTTIASISNFFASKGWLERRVAMNASMAIPISLGGTESYWVNYENNGVQMTSLKPADLCSDCEGPPVQCKNPVVQTGGYLFEREGGTFKQIIIKWTHDGKNDTATKSFTIEIDSLPDAEIPVQVNESSVVEYQHTLPSSAVQTLFNYMQVNNLDKIPITITGKTGTTDVCPASDTIMIEKPPTEQTYGCTNNRECKPMAAGTYLNPNCNNECPIIDRNGYSCVGPGGACQEVVGDGEYTTSNCDNACPTGPTQYGCNANEQCVMMAGGAFTDSECNNTCPTVDEDRFGCNASNQCVSMPGGGFPSDNCNNACQCVGDDCVPGSEVRVSFNYVTDTTSCLAQTPPESGITGKYALHSNSVTAPISTSPVITLGDGPIAVTTGIPISELRRATVGYTNPGYFCNACDTSGGFTGLCTAPVLTSNPDLFEFRVSVQHISSLLNSWWQSVGGRTYGLSVSSAVPNAAATALLPDYDESNKEATDQYLTRSPGWTKGLLGGFLLANTITFRDAANPFGVPKPFTSERDNTQTHAIGLDGTFVNLTLPQRTNDASTSMYNYFAHELDLEANGDLLAATSAWENFDAIKAGERVADPGGGNDYWLVDVQGDLTIDPDTTINVADGENIILMVNGSVTIKGLDTADPYKVISVAPDALLLVIASGDITIDEKVGETIEISTDMDDPPTFPTLEESSTRTATKAALEGMFLSDGTITIQSNNSDTIADKRFVGAGNFVGKTGVVMEREYSKEGMGPEQKINGRLLYGYTPTEIFFHRPDMVLNLPLVLNVGILQYQEVL